MDEHPLLTKRMMGVLTIIGLSSSSAIAAISSHRPLIAAILSGAGFLGAISIYGDDLKILCRSIFKIEQIRPELKILIAILFASLVLPIIFYSSDVVTSGVSARQLSPTERSSFIQSIAKTKNGGPINVFSSLSCDECERYAQEFRDAINAVQGWSGTGGPDIFGTGALRGIKIYTRSLKNAPETTKAIADALNSANIRFEWAEDQKTSDTNEGAIYIARGN